jgi:hypothetical protein
MSGWCLAIDSKPKGLLRRRTLSADEWEELGQAVIEVITAYLEEHLTEPAEKETLEALDDVVEVSCEDAAGVSLIFQEHWYLGAVCGLHWFTLALAARWEQVASLYGERGQSLRGGRPDVAAEYGPRESYAMASVGEQMLAVHPNGEALIDDQVVRYDAGELDDEVRARAKDLYDNGLCHCSLCEQHRPAGVAGKAPALRRAPEPEKPAYMIAIEAAERGDLERLDETLASGAIDPEQAFERGVRSPKAITVKHLLALGHVPSAEAAANAARYDAVDALQLLIGAGIDLEAHDDMGRTPLMNAAMYGSVEALRVLLAAGAEVDARDPYHGSTALLWAITGSESESPETIAEILVAAGASTEQKDDAGKGVVEWLALIEDETRRAAISRVLTPKS